MPQRVQPLAQHVVKLRGFEGSVIVTELRPNAGDYVVLPDYADDVEQLHPTRSGSDLFYLSGTGDSIVNFDLGADRNLVIVSRHRGSLSQ